MWSTSEHTAIKVYTSETPFAQEVAVYSRLSKHNIAEVNGHQVPQITRSDEELGIVEMTVVRRPFLLDFASARLDSPPDFSAEVLDEWWARKRDDFGPNWPATVAILRRLEKLGIYMTDVHPGNIGFVEAGNRSSRPSSSSSS